MNFESGTSLAEFQDRLFKQWVGGDHAICDVDNQRLNGNLWVAVAKKLGPNNLAIRHRCLQDLFNGNKKSLNDILDMYKILSPGLWAEGYSYWLYTKPFLLEWGKLYYICMDDFVKMMDQRFLKTAYMGPDRLLYPAPFGDLRKEPLELNLQGGRPDESASFKPAMKNGSMYMISSYPLGGNTHVPIKDEVIKIVNGVPEGFKFYEGYDKKYPNKLAAFLDVIKPIRIFSMFR
jgi:hypothetical protein